MDLIWKLYFLTPLLHVQLIKHSQQQKQIGVKVQAVGSSGYTDLSLIERMVPIKSYDIAIYSDDGRELWKKENQAIQGGGAYERVTLEERILVISRLASGI